MPEATRIRTQTNGDKTVVRVLITHPMESGQRRDAAGQRVPAWFIQELSVRLNERVVLSAEWGPSVARDPFLQFTLKGARPGDRLELRWLDNRGERRSDELVLT